jgi:hypothetical protein
MNCLQGFLDRPPAIEIPFRSSIRPQISGSYQLRRQPTLDDEPYDIPDYWSLQWVDMQLSSWNSRAWTYQEAELSRRKLYFGRMRLHLSLRDVWLSETEEPEQSTDYVFHHSLSKFKASGDCEIMYSSWQAMVVAYVGMDLSDRQDIFPAIAGLVRLISLALEDECIAGLWRKDLVRGLLWITIESSLKARSQDEFLHQKLHPGSEGYICPLWSWAQFPWVYYLQNTHRSAINEDDKRFTGFSLRSECDTLSAKSWPVNEDLNPYGRIRDARLYAEAKCIKIITTLWHAHHCQHYQSWRVTLPEGSIAMCHLDWALPRARELQGLVLENVSMLLLASTIAGLRSDDVKGLADYLMPSEIWTCQDSSQHGYDTTRNAWGLLVHPIGEGKFIRMGRFDLWAEFGGLRAFKDCEWTSFELV